MSTNPDESTTNPRILRLGQLTCDVTQADQSFLPMLPSSPPAAWSSTPRACVCTSPTPHTHDPPAPGTPAQPAAAPRPQGHSGVADFVAGAFAGGIICVITQPFDTVKVILQSQPGRFTSPMQCFRSVVANSPLAMFRGMGVPLITAPLFHAVVFSAYGSAKRLLTSLQGAEAEQPWLSGSNARVSLPSTAPTAPTAPTTALQSTARAGSSEAGTGSPLFESGAGLSLNESLLGSSGVNSTQVKAAGTGTPPRALEPWSQPRSHPHPHPHLQPSAPPAGHHDHLLSVGHMGLVVVNDEVDDASLALWQLAAAGAWAGLASSFVIGPVDLVKIQLQAQATLGVVKGTAAAAEAASRAVSAVSLAPVRQPVRYYKGPLDFIATALRANGIGAVFQGFRATVAVETIAIAAQFYTYEGVLRALAPEAAGGVGATPHEPSVTQQLLAGGASGMMANGIIYPLDVIKTRLQALPVGVPSPAWAKPHAWLPDGGMVGVAQHVLAREGWAGFGRGIVPCLIPAFPANAAGFVVYEAVIRLWERWGAGV